VLARVENHESYRKIAADYGVSRETIRRLVRASKKAGSLRDISIYQREK
jgi:predicted transcriptional regulator